MKRLYETPCVVCGTLIVSPRLHRKACSPECLRKYRNRLVREKYRQKKSIMSCAYCHGEFTPKKAGQIYCGRKCSVAAMNVRKTALYLTDDRKPRPIVKVAGGPATRACLCCGRSFASQWIGNRICTPCIRIANKSATNEDLAEAS